MGGGITSEAISPWIPMEANVHKDLTAEELEPLKDTILKLTQKPDVFLCKHKESNLDAEFLNKEDVAARIQGAIEADQRIPVWINKLVPKRVTEEDFWLNYFSHVERIVDLFTREEAGEEVVEIPCESSLLTADEQENEKPPDGTEIETEESTTSNPDFDKLDAFLFEPYDDAFKPAINHKEQRDLGENIRWGIVECDIVSEKSSIALSFAHGSDVIAVMSRDEKKAQEFAQRHAIRKVYTSAKVLINDDEVDAVYIASPPGTHKELAIMVAEAGKPCMVETPIARSYYEGQQMMQAFDRASVPLYLAYYWRYLPRFVRAKQIVKQLGTVTSISYTHLTKSHLLQANEDLGWRILPKDSGGGLFMNVGCRVLDIIDYLVGPLTHTRGNAIRQFAPHPENLQVPTCVSAIFRAGTSLGSLLFNFASPKEIDQLIIVGAQGSLQMSIFGDEAPLISRPQPSGAGKVEKISTVTKKVKCPPVDNMYLPLIRNIVNELRGVSPEEGCGSFALRTAKVMDNILQDYYKDRNDDFWKRPETFGDSA